MKNLFRLELYRTDDENKHSAEYKHEYLGDAESIWNLWFLLSRKERLNFKHVEVYSMSGNLCNPLKGLDGLYSNS